MGCDGEVMRLRPPLPGWVVGCGVVIDFRGAVHKSMVVAQWPELLTGNLDIPGSNHTIRKIHNVGEAGDFFLCAEKKDKGFLGCDWPELLG